MLDFLVVGGGVVGLSLAWELARRKQRVCVVDRQQMGRATSWVGAGIFPPPRSGAQHDALEQLRTTSHQLHKEWSQRLLAETGVDNELHTCGGIYFARRTGEAVSLKVDMLRAQEDGVHFEELSPSEVAEREPSLATIVNEIRSAYLLPNEMQIRSPRHLQALKAACEKAGVDFQSKTNVTGLQVDSDRITGLETDRGILRANRYCLCSGAWAGQLLEPLGIHVPVEPWRGQLLLWKTGEPLLSHVINEGLRYFVPRTDGYLLAGATVEDVGFDCQTTAEATEELRAFSLSLLPQLANQEPEQAWAGLRPKTPDGHPFMDHVPGLGNLSVCAGHYRSGLHLSPASAVFMADLLLDDTAADEPSPFRIQR